MLNDRLGAKNKPHGFAEPMWLIRERMANLGDSYPSALTVTPIVGPVICIAKTTHHINQRANCQHLIERIQKGEHLLPKYDHSEDEIIFVKWFRHWRTGRRVYPKNGQVIAIRIRKKPKEVA